MPLRGKKTLTVGKRPLMIPFGALYKYALFNKAKEQHKNKWSLRFF